MSPSEFALLRSLVEWRRKNGWTQNFNRWDREQHDHAYDHNQSGLSVEVDMHRVELFPGDPKVHYEIRVDAAGHLLFHGWPWSVRSAVDGIASAGVIPPEMAPMFQAGRESAYDRDEWMVRAKRCHISATVYITAEDAAEALAYWRGIGISDSYLEHRRVARKPAWVRVPEAGGNDADA